MSLISWLAPSSCTSTARGFRATKTNRADLVVAKLHPRLVPVSPDRLVAIRNAYRAVADAVQAISAAGVTFRVTPARRPHPPRSTGHRLTGHIQAPWWTGVATTK
jgi:hypothetical protein